MSNEVLDSATQICAAAGVLGGDVLVAVSGGLDSVCLLHVLLALRDRHGGRVEVAHVDHGLRPSARDDAEFCRELAQRCGVPCHSTRLDSEMPRGGQGVQAWAREERRRYFRRLLEQRGLAAVALGHHADDQVETVLYRLLRGTGLRGAAGMREVSPPYVRPLLHTRRAELARWAERSGWTHREDPTNCDLRYARNRLRRQIVPQLAAVHPGAEGALLRFARLAQVEDDFLTRLTREFLAAHAVAEPEGIRLPTAALTACDAALRWRVYLAAWQLIGCDPGALQLSHLETVDQLLRPGKAHRRAPLPGPGRFAVSYGQLWIHSPQPSLPLDLQLEVRCGASAPLPAAGASVAWDDAPPAGLPALEVGLLQRDAVLQLRPWRPGDRVPLPGGRWAKVKDVLMRHKVPLWRRRQALVVQRQGVALGLLAPFFAAGAAGAGGSWIWYRNGPPKHGPGLEKHCCSSRAYDI